MATKSFLKEINIKDKKSANSFILALENAEKRKNKGIRINKKVQQIKDIATIKKMFGE